MGKIDLITASKKKSYRITIVVLLVVGVLCLGVGFIMQATLTSAVTPNRLNVVFPGRQPTSLPNHYQVVISKDIGLEIDTGTGTRTLAQPIIITLDEGASQFLTAPVTTTYHDEKPLWLNVTPDAALNGTKGTVTVSCGSFRIVIEVTYCYVAA